MFFQSLDVLLESRDAAFSFIFFAAPFLPFSHAFSKRRDTVSTGLEDDGMRSNVWMESGRGRNDRDMPGGKKEGS